MAEDRSWKSSLTAMEVAVLDVGLIIVAWLGSGMAFYYFCDEGWTPAYSVFFAVNVGLGVGYGEFMPTRPATKYFTSFYCLVGTSVVMGGLAVLFTCTSRLLNEAAPIVCASEFAADLLLCSRSARWAAFV